MAKSLTITADPYGESVCVGDGVKRIVCVCVCVNTCDLLSFCLYVTCQTLCNAHPTMNTLQNQGRTPTASLRIVCRLSDVPYIQRTVVCQSRQEIKLVGFASGGAAAVFVWLWGCNSTAAFYSVCCQVSMLVSFHSDHDCRSRRIRMWGNNLIFMPHEFLRLSKKSKEENNKMFVVTVNTNIYSCQNLKNI